MRNWCAVTPLLFLEHSNQVLQSEVTGIFDRYSSQEIDPRMHPILPYIAEEWDRAAVESRALDIDALKLEDVSQKCTDRAAKHPLWSSELHMQDLTSLLGDVSVEDMWWLPPLPRVTGM
jgi:hypothetical protein